MAVVALSIVVAALLAAALGVALIVRHHPIVGVLAVVLGATGILLWTSNVVKAYRAPSESMVPELDVGSRFLVLRLGYEPRIGDVVVFHPPAGAATNECAAVPTRGQMCAASFGRDEATTFVKRIVAGPGDRISMRGGRVTVNGRAESGYALRPCEDSAACEFPREIRVPEGNWFMLGDNRGASDDSRFWGPVPRSAILGRKWVTYIKGP